MDDFESDFNSENDSKQPDFGSDFDSDFNNITQNQELLPDPNQKPADPRGMGEFPIESQPYAAFSRGGLESILAGTTEAGANLAGIAKKYDPNSPQFTNPYTYSAGEIAGSLLPLGKLGSAAKAGVVAAKSGISALVPKIAEGVRIAGTYGAGLGASEAVQREGATTGSVLQEARNRAIQMAPFGLLPVGIGLAAERYASKFSPHFTTSTMGDTALQKTETAKPIDLHEAIGPQETPYLNAIASAKNSNAQNLNKIGFAEAVRKDPVGTSSREGLKSAIQNNIDEVSSAYNTAKETAKPVVYDSVIDDVNESIKNMTLDDGQRATLSGILTKYEKGKPINLAMAMNDENNANSMYQKMVLAKGLGSHEAKMYSAERDALSKIVDNGLDESGIPNASKYGKIYRGSKNLLQSIEDMELRASKSLSRNDKSKYSPLTIGSGLFGLGKIGRAFMTQDIAEGIEGAGLLGAAAYNHYKRKSVQELKDIDLALEKLHSSFTKKVKIEGKENPINAPISSSKQGQKQKQSQESGTSHSLDDAINSAPREQALDFMRQHGSQNPEPFYQRPPTVPRLQEASLRQLMGEPNLEVMMPLASDKGRFYTDPNKLPGGLPLRPDFMPQRMER